MQDLRGLSLMVALGHLVHHNCDAIPLQRRGLVASQSCDQDSQEDARTAMSMLVSLGKADNASGTLLNDRGSDDDSDGCYR
jgi:hypothetical protein